MKTLTHTLMSAAAVIVLQAPLHIQAQDMDFADRNMVGEGMVMRQDKVGADLHSPADKKSAQVYDRKVMFSNNGMYSVVVMDEKGNTRMEGSYADLDLTLASGEFTYYHPNGNVESKGMYANGQKTGTWYRYNADGSPKAERNYTGMTWEDMAVTLGMASKAGSN